MKEEEEEEEMEEEVEEVEEEVEKIDLLMLVVFSLTGRWKLCSVTLVEVCGM